MQITGHIVEYTMFMEGTTPVNYYDAEGRCKGERASTAVKPTRLEWSIPDELSLVIDRQLACARHLADDLDMRIVNFDYFGKGFIKTCKVSPDAFVQMALQIAYFRVTFLLYLDS